MAEGIKVEPFYLSIRVAFAFLEETRLRPGRITGTLDPLSAYPPEGQCSSGRKAKPADRVLSVPHETMVTRRPAVI